MNNRNGNSWRPVVSQSIRVTRSRARAAASTGENFPVPKPCLRPVAKLTSRENTKRAFEPHGTSSNVVFGAATKRRAVLRDVTNVTCDYGVSNCIKASQIQKNPPRKCSVHKREGPIAPCSEKVRSIKKDTQTPAAEGVSTIAELETQDGPASKVESGKAQQVSREDGTNAIIPILRVRHLQHKHHPTNDKKFINVDSTTTDPQLCGLYAPDIHSHSRLQELDQRPSTTYMETLQRDITPCMRGILIDWLVEVCEEYKLVPDTLYLTINLLDRFLSHNQIEKNRLQLLGVTCMLISSKYEEICAPRVEEFCIITDNTYTRDEVLDLENHVLNFLYFRLSVPTTKTFLRRFIFVAQACSKVVAPSELEFLANYLAELTLLEYDFLNYLPSMIAASAVFLASWILNHAVHPWNPTLEHYTNYSASDLKSVVVALEDLQLNTTNSPLRAIREKYKQPKFKCVAALTSSKRVLTLF